MRLTCPNCGAQYEVTRDAVPPEGRDVQCSNCGVTWLATPVPEAEAGTDAPAAPAPRSTITPEIAEILRAEAEREAAARRRAAAPPSAETASEPMAEPEPELDRALDAAPEAELDAEAEAEAEAEAPPISAFDDVPDGAEDRGFADDEEMGVADQPAAASDDPKDHDRPEAMQPAEQPASAPPRREADLAPFGQEGAPASSDQDSRTAPIGDGEAAAPAPERFDPFEETDEDEAEIDFEAVTPDRPRTGPDAPRIDSRDLWEEEEDEADSDFERLLRGERLEAEADPDAPARQADLEALQGAVAPAPGGLADREDAPAEGGVPQEDTPSASQPEAFASPSEAAPHDDRIDDDLDDPALMASLSVEEPDEPPRPPEESAPFEPMPREERDAPDEWAARSEWAEAEDIRDSDVARTDATDATDEMIEAGDETARDREVAHEMPDRAAMHEIPDRAAMREAPAAADETALHEAARQRASVAAASTGAVTRRDLLPDIEEINSSLRSTAMRGPAHRVAEPGDMRRGRGFRLGFGTALLIAAALVLIYANAGGIGAALPPLAGPLDAFAGWVDTLRAGLDAWLRGLLAALG